MTDTHPGASPYKDRHGRPRWRYRAGGVSRSLPQAPGHPDFEAHYQAAIAGLPAPRRAQVHRLPTAAHPRSLRAAFRLVRENAPEWPTWSDAYRGQLVSVAERFFADELVEGEPLRYGDMPIDQLKRRHVKAILARYSDTPHAARHIFKLLRKLIGAALDEEWIEYDPTFRMRYSPKYKGWRAWTAEECAAFEARWPIGSTPRLVYTIALLTGARRGDITRLLWSDLDAQGIDFTVGKTSRGQWLPILEALRAALDAAPRTGKTVLMTQYGKPFSGKALGMRMQRWSHAAAIGPGTTIHGLRKTLGKLLAENGATAHQIKAILGHRTLAQAQLYTDEAEQKRMARDGMATLSVMFGGKDRAG